MSSIEDWQRLSPMSVVYLFLRGTLSIVRENLPLLFGAGAGVAVLDSVGLREVALLLGVLLASRLLLALWQYRRFTFRIDGDLLLVRKGIFEQSELKVRSVQIQQVLVEAPWHLRLFGLVRFSVDTPGGASTEVELPGIRPVTAAALRRALEAEDRVEDAGLQPTPNQTLHQTSTTDLIMHGLANNYAWVALLALMPLLHRLAQSQQDRLETIELPPWIDSVLDYPLLAAAGGIAAIVLILMIASIVIALLRFHGFRLERDDRSTALPRFRQTSGWASRREQILNSARLQVVEEVQTPIGRLLGRSQLLCRQIGNVQIEQDPNGQLFLIPGLDRDSSERLLAALWPDRVPATTMERVHPYYRRITWLRLTLISGALLGVMVQQTGDLRWGLPWVVLMLVFAGLAHLRWLAVGFAVQEGWLEIRFGLIGHRRSTFPAIHVQRVQIRQNFFQRRREVADLTLTLATGPITLPCLSEDRAWNLFEDILERIEQTGPAIASEQHLAVRLDS